MKYLIIFFIITTFSTSIFSQNLNSKYDFDESLYDNQTQKELGLNVLKSFNDFKEDEYFEKFVINIEVFKYVMSNILVKKGMDLEKIKFNEKIQKLFNAKISKHRTRVNLILDKVKSQNVKLNDCMIDSSFSQINNTKYDIIKEGSVTVYLSDGNDNYRFKITGLNQVKGKWFISEPQIYWHNKSEIELIKKLD